jgi:uncharacterized protein (TIGR03067 family)
MRRFTLAAATCVLTVVCCQALAGDAELKALEGTWQITELIANGVKVAEKDIAGMKFVFSKEMDKDKKAFTQLTIVPPPADTGIVEKRTFSLKFLAGKKPAEVNSIALDGEFKGASSPAIYEVKGDVLRWCQSDDEKAAERPKDFASPKESRLYLFTFKRAK